ncbi:hypothetical protein PG994_007081 [Apiospora phragmitis]|uniref:C2H2-type domain-containing protein n=1 Tax=Apiospora phragmitis TaxID=2905665 RepID=A0ABR1V338_9PEZI
MSPWRTARAPTSPPAIPRGGEMLAYFSTLMSTPGMTLDQILRDHFTPHELRKFMPTIDEPFAKWQREDTELFKRTLETRFKGVLPTLGMKMTMLYFGLPVAPMKLGGNQYVTTSDLMEPQDEVVIERDPLDFLDGYKQRCFGLPPSEVTYIPMGPAPRRDETESLGLHGGNLEDEDLDLLDSESQCDEEMESQPQDGSVTELGLRGGSGSPPRYHFPNVWSSGASRCGRGYEGLARGLTRLLSLNTAERDVALIFTILSPSNGRTEVKATVQVPIAVPDADEEGALSDVLARIEAQESPRVFIRKGRDEAPGTFEPKPLEGGIATITIKGKDGLERVGYLRTASRPNLNHSVAQYAPGYQHTINALIGSHHQYVTFPEVVGPAGPVSIYSCEDLPQKLVSDMATHTYCSIKAKVKPLDPHIVPVILPDSQNFHKSNAIELFRQNLGDLEGLNRVVEHALSRQPHRGQHTTGIHIFFPGEDFQDGDYQQAVFIELADGKATQAALDQWSQKVGGSKYYNPAGVSLVALPWYDTYILSMPHSMQTAPDYKPVEVRLHECTLDLFKLRVSTHLYTNLYQPYSKEHTLILEDDTRSYRHIIAFGCTEANWRRIRLRFMSQNIQITLKTQDQEVRWRAASSSESYTGSSHHASVKSGSTGFSPFGVKSSVGSTKSFETSKSQEIADNLYRTYSSRLNDFMQMKGSDNSMRDLTVWDTPSIFTNPMKPVMPLHAPSLESVIRTGPDVPAITLGMRTATEMARLEREVHTLRGQLLDRIRVCPYIDCEQRFSFLDTQGFERHIKYEHKILQCSLCTAFPPPNGKDLDIDRSLLSMDREQILQHMSDVHVEQLQSFILPPKGAGRGSKVWEKATPEQKKKVQLILFPFCIHCGRHELKLDDPEDMFYHHLTCRGNDAENRKRLTPAPFCKACGGPATTNTYGQIRCADAACAIHDPNVECNKDCCEKCGFNQSGCSKAYRTKHGHFCRALPGGDWDGVNRFCPFCGIFVEDLDAEEQEEHIWLCRERPQPRPTKCPSCDESSATLLYTPQEVQRHLETCHGGSARCPWCEEYLVGKSTQLEWSDGAKHYHFAHHMGQVAPSVRTETEDGAIPGSQCPYFHECGAHTTDMSGDQWSRHMERNHPTRTFYPNGMPDSNRSGPPSGYSSHSLSANSHHNKHGKRVGNHGAHKLTATVPGSSSHSSGKKRPHSHDMPPPHPAAASSASAGSGGLFSKDTWGSAIVDDDDSEWSYESNGKRRKVSFEHDPTYAQSHSHGSAKYEPYEYMDTRQDSDQGQDLDQDMAGAPPQSPQQHKKKIPAAKGKGTPAKPATQATKTATGAAGVSTATTGGEHPPGWPWKDIYVSSKTTKKASSTPTTATAPVVGERVPGEPYIAEITSIIRPGQQYQQHQQEQHHQQEEEVRMPSPTAAAPQVGPRGPGEPYIASITPIIRPTPVASVEGEGEEEEGDVIKTGLFAGTPRASGRKTRPTAAKLASEAEATAAATPAASTGRRGQTPAKSPTKTTANTRTTRSVSLAEETASLPPPTEEPAAAKTTRAGSPAKRGRPRK